MSPVVTAFVKQQQSFKGKKVMCFTTSGFPDPLSGAKNAHAAIKSRLENCGASVIEGTRLWWGFYCRKKTLDKTVAEICSKIG
jgi:hypothetical protein